MLRTSFFCLFYLYSIFFTVAIASKEDKIMSTFHLTTTNSLYILDVKDYQQTEDYTCAPAAVMSILNYYGFIHSNELNKNTELHIANEMGSSPSNGTSPKQIVDWLNKNGFNAKSYTNGKISDVLKYLYKGIPVLVEWIDWGGHWVVLSGYQKLGKSIDDDKDTMFLTDPSAHSNNVESIYGLTAINPDRFQSMWFDAQYFNPGHVVYGIYIVAFPKGKS